MMKKTLLLSVMVLGLLAPKANAVTVDELVNNSMSVKVAYYNTNENVWLHSHGEVFYEKNSRGNLVVQNLFQGYGSLELRISGNNVYLYLPSQNYVVYVPTLGGNYLCQNSSINEFTTYFIPMKDTSGNVYTEREYNTINSKVIGTVGQKNGQYYININTPFTICLYDSSDRESLYYYTHNGMYMEGFNINAYMTYDVSNYLMGMIERDNLTFVNVNLNSNGSLTVENWGNLGFSYMLNNSSQKQDSPVTGTWNLNNGTMSINGGAQGTMVLYNSNRQIAGFTKSFFGSNWRLTNSGESYLSYSNVNGKITLPKPTHNDFAENRWMDNPDMGTFQQMIVDFGDWTYGVYFIGYNSYAMYAYPNGVVKDYSKVQLVIPEYKDLTHQVKINKNAYGYGKISDIDNDTYLYINCNLQDYVNPELVESYELYIVPQITNPTYTGNNFKNANGHVNGTRIDLPEYFTYFPNYPSKKEGMSKVQNLENYDIPENPFEGNIYNLLIPEKDLKVSNTNGSYMLYVKAIYTPESGLEPTFHALTALGGTTTGVESIIDKGENLDDAPVYFYNMNGVQVDGNNLTPGLYIRRQGATSTKVLIK